MRTLDESLQQEYGELILQATAGAPDSGRLAGRWAKWAAAISSGSAASRQRSDSSSSARCPRRLPVGCAAAPTLGVLTVARVFQGIGGAMMVPVGRLVVLRSTDKSELIKAIAYLTWPALIAPVLAPPLGVAGAAAHLGELGDELDALRLAAGQRRAGLAQGQVAEADVLQ